MVVSMIIPDEIGNACVCVGIHIHALFCIPIANLTKRFVKIQLLLLHLPFLATLPGSGKMPGSKAIPAVWHKHYDDALGDITLVSKDHVKFSTTSGVLGRAR
jgi:hypothetical protein